MEAKDLKTRFEKQFGREPRLYRAPGRVNLIGEHTDYNDGFVMPAAINFFTWAAIATRDDRRVTFFSENFNETVEFDLDEHEPKPNHHWSDYPRGVAVMLNQAGYRLTGADIYIYGEVPIGSGLSSSAAIEVSTGYALLDISSIQIDRIKLAQICQHAENHFVGTRSGIMDQFISCCGESEHALMLDCRSLGYELLPVADVVKLVICNTMVKHELATGEYNLRRRQCEEGVTHLQKSLPGIRALRDVSPVELEQHGRDLPEVIYRRCLHVVTENERVAMAAMALKQDDLTAFGELMEESHRSLRDNYEVSCAELDVMVELANKIDGVIGARMTGGGFGGCTVNLVKTDKVDNFVLTIKEQYEEIVGLLPEVYISSIVDGASEIKL